MVSIGWTECRDFCEVGDVSYAWVGELTVSEWHYVNYGRRVKASYLSLSARCRLFPQRLV